MKELKGYYRSIRRNLPVFGKLKKQIMSHIRQSVDEYVAENPNAQYDDIVKHFGAPKEIADAYITEMTTPEILKKYKVKKVILIILCIVASIILLIWASAFGLALIILLLTFLGNFNLLPSTE